METKTKVYLVIGIALAILIGGMLLQKNFPAFSVLSTSRTCSSWLVNEQLPSTTTVPFTWQYTSSQQRCVTEMTASASGGCQLTYNQGGCTPTSVICNSSQTQPCLDSNGCSGTQTCANNAWGACTSSLTKCYDGTCQAVCPAPPTTCTPSQRICVGESIYQQCLANSQWSGNLNCASGTKCVNGICTNTCVTTWNCGDWSACFNNEQNRVCTDSCDSGHARIEYQTCSVCPSGQTLCADNTCKSTCQECVPGSTACVDTSSYKQCLTNGLWSGKLNCDSGKFCTGTSCQLPCSPDNSCADNTCIGSTCLNNCGTILQGTKTCTICTDTCNAKGFACGTQTICGQSTDCGSCSNGQTCSSGKCITTTPSECLFTIGDTCIKLWMLLAAGGAVLLVLLFKK